jgi:hypothetical protein
MTDKNMAAKNSAGKNTNRLEDELKRVLSRQEAPPDFADTVFARIGEQNSMREVACNPWWKVLTQPLVRWAAITATATSLVIGGIHYRRQQVDRVRGEAAKQQLMLALRIAGSKLQLAKTKVNEINATQRN